MGEGSQTLLHPANNRAPDLNLRPLPKVVLRRSSSAFVPRSTGLFVKRGCWVGPSMTEGGVREIALDVVRRPCVGSMLDIVYGVMEDYD